MDLSLYTAKQLSKLPFINELKVTKNELDSLRPLAKDIEERVIQKFRLNWNYHSNSIDRFYSNKIIINYFDSSIETHLRNFENHCIKSLLKKLKSNTNT